MASTVVCVNEVDYRDGYQAGIKFRHTHKMMGWLNSGNVGCDFFVSVKMT